MKFIDHTQRSTEVGRTPLDEWLFCRRDLYLTTHNNHRRLTSMPLAGSEIHNRSKRTAANPKLTLRSHWDRHL